MFDYIILNEGTNVSSRYKQKTQLAGLQLIVHFAASIPFNSVELH